MGIHILDQANKQEFSPLGYLLTFAAIEAIFCEPPEKSDTTISKQLKRWLPTLLTQDSSSREMAGKQISTLYDMRCKISHGARMDVSERQLHSVKKLASGLIIGFCHWLDHCRRNGYEFSHRRLITLLSASYRNEDEIIDMPDLKEMIL